MIKKIITIFFSSQKRSERILTAKRSNKIKNDEQKFMLINKRATINFEEREQYYKRTFNLYNQL